MFIFGADLSTSAWLPNTELTKLDPEECKDFPEKGKTKSLIQAYHVAAEGHDLEYFKAMLLDHQKAMQEDQERREAREAAKAEKAERAEKKKRKSETAEEDEDVDMEDAEEEAKPEPKKPSKKRKKEAESEVDDEKVCADPANIGITLLMSMACSLQRLPRPQPSSSLPLQRHLAQVTRRPKTRVNHLKQSLRGRNRRLLPAMKRPRRS